MLDVGVLMASVSHGGCERLDPGLVMSARRGDRGVDAWLRGPSGFACWVAMCIELQSCNVGRLESSSLSVVSVGWGGGWVDDCVWHMRWMVAASSTRHDRSIDEISIGCGGAGGAELLRHVEALREHRHLCASTAI